MKYDLHTSRVHYDIIVIAVEEEEHVTGKKLKQAESLVWTKNRTWTCSNWLARIWRTWSSWGVVFALIMQRTSFCVGTLVWQSKLSRSAEKMKMGRNGGLLTAWSTLFEWSGIGPVKPERVVFSDNSSSFTRFWLQCDQMCYLEYMQKNSAFTTGEYEVTRSPSSTTMMMMSSCALGTPTSGL